MHILLIFHTFISKKLNFTEMSLTIVEGDLLDIHELFEANTGNVWSSHMHVSIEQTFGNDLLYLHHCQLKIKKESFTPHID